MLTAWRLRASRMRVPFQVVLLVVFFSVPTISFSFLTHSCISINSICPSVLFPINLQPFRGNFLYTHTHYILNSLLGSACYAAPTDITQPNRSQAATLSLKKKNPFNLFFPCRWRSTSRLFPRSGLLTACTAPSGLSGARAPCLTPVTSPAICPAPRLYRQRRRAKVWPLFN